MGNREELSERAKNNWFKPDWIQDHDLGIRSPNGGIASKTQGKVQDAGARLRQAIIRTLAILLPHLASFLSGMGISVSVVLRGVLETGYG
jgi:hypothetical protein